ncbi:unnamed protein product [Nyctereutes procyonoides]|uniref:(raccoon dog) hypothetical protein n=1 Tax=Nyctereutes procyonoides TaxID=34880 RepID=A0A811YXL5_NYCPR|nr:unnamed protein product [Nyctereutes procyonoides]
MPENKLTISIAHFLDWHLIYKEKEFLQGKFDLLSDTNMIDFSKNVYKTFILMIFHMLYMRKTFEDSETTRQMQSTRDGQMLFDYLVDRYAKFQYECWNHSGQQTWLIHWSLFSSTTSKGTITMHPHILHYLTIAIITNKDVQKCQQSYAYKDASTEYVKCLYVTFDFDRFQKKLKECESNFIESARLFIFETFCHIHLCICINMLADKLNMTMKEVKKWIFNLIRNTRLDAKIDSKLDKSLSFKHQMLAMNIEKKLNQKSRAEPPGLPRAEVSNWEIQDSDFY